MEIESLLKENHIKVTKGRLTILHVLMLSDEPLSVEQIYKLCREYEVFIDLSTVYRTLELLEEKEIVDKFSFGDGKFTYKVKTSHHKHIIQCKVCHKEVEIDCPMKQLEEIIRNKTGFTFVDKDIFINNTIEGLCSKCSKEEEKK